MTNQTKEIDCTWALSALSLISRSAGDKVFGDQLEKALANSDLNKLSDLLPQAGVDRSVFSFTTSDNGVAVEITCPNGGCVIIVIEAPKTPKTPKS